MVVFSERSEGALREARVYIPLGRSVVKKKLPDRPTDHKKYTIYEGISPKFLKPTNIFLWISFVKFKVLGNVGSNLHYSHGLKMWFLLIFLRIEGYFNVNFKAIAIFVVKPTNIFKGIFFVNFNANSIFLFILRDISVPIPISYFGTFVPLGPSVLVYAYRAVT